MSKNIQRPTARLRELLARPGCLVAPGVADAFAARLVKMDGFEAVYMTGFGTSLTVTSVMIASVPSEPTSRSVSA